MGLRVWAVFALGPDRAGPFTYEHGRIAENLLAGRGFSIELLGADGPTSQQAPFYPFLLAGAYACFGVGSSAAIVAVQLLQCLAGTALVLAVAWLAWSLVPDRPELGWIAGLGAAVYPTHVYMVTHMQVAVWAALFLTLLLAVAVSPHWRGRRAGSALLGTLAGVLLLIEPILALALPIVALAYWLGQSKRFSLEAAGRVAVVAGVAGAVIAPWLARNRLVHGEFVFVKSTFGYAFWQGNNPASWGTDKIPRPDAERLRQEHDGTLADADRALWDARLATPYIDDVVLTPADYQRLGRLSEPARCRALGREAWAFVREHPAHYARLCAARLGYFLLFDETNPKAAHRLYRAGTIAWLVLALVGLLISVDRWRALWPTYAIFAAVALFHALVITSVRFRIPLEPMTFVWASAALGPLAERLGLARRVRIYRPGQSPDPFDAGHVLQGPHYSTRETPSRRRAG